MNVYLNDRIIGAESARIEPTDRGLLLGDGLFETIAVFGAKLRRLDRHFARLRGGARVIGLPVPTDDEGLARALAETRNANEIVDGLLRLTLTRGPALRGVLPAPGARPTLLITASPRDTASPSPARAVISTATRRNEHSPLSRLKTLNYLDNVIARREAEARGADEAILINTVGRLAETTVANLYVVIVGETLTPPVEDGALPGVVRAELLESGLAAERSLNPDAFRHASEAFTTNSGGIRAIVAVDGRAIGDGRPGPVQASLQAII
ncbi:MAG: aminotransferase class IV [Rhodospirillales bacterium]|nr:aminotransferase class IV [Rhodospirillales bacterium]